AEGERSPSGRRAKTSRWAAVRARPDAGRAREEEAPTPRVGSRVGLSDALRARSRALATGPIRLADAPARPLPAGLEPPARELASPEDGDHRRQGGVRGRHGRHARSLGYVRASRRRAAADRSVGGGLSPG